MEVPHLSKKINIRMDEHVKNRPTTGKICLIGWDIRKTCDINC